MCWSERMDGRTRLDSIWLMNPLVSSSPASCAWLSPASRRAERTRSPSVFPALGTSAAPALLDPFGSVGIIASHDTEHRRLPTMGSVVEMRSVQAALLAIVATLALIGAVTSIADASTD